MKQKLDVRIEPETHSELRKDAQQRGWTLSKLIRWILQRYLRERKDA